MEQYLSTDQKDFFSGIIANPEGIDAVHAAQLKTLVDLYPQSGILRAMLARASQVYDQGGFQQKLKSAAVYAPDRAVLYNLINYPEKLQKYVEPFNDVVEEEEEISLFEDDYSNYQQDEQAVGYEEETVYESEPINYFHESEEPFQHTVEDRTNFNPVAEPVSSEQKSEYFSYNFPPTQAESVEPIANQFAETPALESYNFPPAEPESVESIPNQFTETGALESYNFPPAEPEQVEPIANQFTETRASEPYNFPLAQAEKVDPAPEYVSPPYQSAVVSDYDYTPPYREEEEEELKAPPGYTYAKPEKPIEPVLPPIPGYDRPLSYQEQIAQAATEVDDEVYDEISGIEDVDVEPIIKHRSNVPDITDNEEEEIAAEEENDNSEEVMMAQYGQQSPANDIAEKPKLTKAEQELADFLAQGSEFYYSAPAAVSHVAEEPKRIDIEPEEVAVEPEPLPEKEYITEHVRIAFEEDVPDFDSDEVSFEMVNPPVAADTFSPIIPRPTPRSQPQPPVNSQALQVQSQNIDEDARVSKYNDDKMPYSFLWWLDKTRKEHAETYQPYVAFKPIITEVQRPGAGDELQQQYFENIFHITSFEQLDIHTREKRKESEIVDRFIQKDPQMKPPNTEKLDNENKAKKSAEDKNELVSETLARIYLDQMLYTKAIATYQKLMLKFPEKSSYFVAQIKLLEKKIN